MLVNVSDQPLTVRVDVDLKSAELPHASRRWRRVSIGDPDDSQPAGGAPAEFPGQVGLEPRSAVAWEWTVAP
jgi:hypothetical protein